MLSGIKVTKRDGRIELLDITKIQRYTVISLLDITSIEKYMNNIFNIDNILMRAYEYKSIILISNKEYKLDLYKKEEIKKQKPNKKITTKHIKNKLQNILFTFQRLLI